MRNRRLMLGGLVLSLALLAAACGGGDGGEQPAGGEGGGSGGGTIEIAGQTANDHGTEDVSGKSEVTVEQDDFYFGPTVLTGEPGQTITVELENEGGAQHTFTIDDQGVDVVVAPGESGTAQVTFPDSGAVLFYCRFHAARGMRGGLSVGGDLGGSGSAGSDTGSGGGYGYG